MTFADWWDEIGRALFQSSPIRDPFHAAKLAWEAAMKKHPEGEPSSEAVRLAEEFVSDPDARAQCKVEIASAGYPLIADMIDEALVLAREILRLRTAAGRKE